MTHSSLGRGGLLIPLVGLALIAACGGTTAATPEDSPAPPVEESAFAQAVANAWCANLGACCATWSYTYSQQACEAAMREFVQKDYVDRAAPLSGVSYDAAKAGECVQLSGVIAAACAPTDQQIEAANAACMGAYVGTKVAGQPCSDDLECAPGSDGQARCDESGSGHTCVDQEPFTQAHGAAGEACAETCAADPGGGTTCWGTSSTSGSASCYVEDGLACSSGGICAPLSPLGQACETGGCVVGATCESGTCVEQRSAGEPCTSSGSCKDGLYCDWVATLVCTASKSNGAACASSEECTSYSCDAGKCVPPNLVANEWACSGVASSNP